MDLSEKYMCLDYGKDSNKWRESL